MSLASLAPAEGQQVSKSDRRAAFVSRAAMEEQAAAAERAAGNPAISPHAREFHRGEAWLLRRRLELGDFAPGDRIVLSVAGVEALTDTFTVRQGPVLLLSNLPPVSLEGVLRSELHVHLSQQLGRFLQEPHITVTPLLRVAVMGPVGRQGFYHVPADMLLTDLVMIAGGPGSNADLSRAHIRRGADALYAAREVRIALSEGMSLDMLGLRSGDEFLIRERRTSNWMSLLHVVTIAVGLVTVITRFTG